MTKILNLIHQTKSMDELVGMENLLKVLIQTQPELEPALRSVVSRIDDEVEHNHQYCMSQHDMAQVR